MNFLEKFGEFVVGGLDFCCAEAVVGVGELDHDYFFTPFQSLKNLAIPWSVRGWWISLSKISGGIVQMSAPRRADCVTCCGLRIEATRI